MLDVCGLVDLLLWTAGSVTTLILCPALSSRPGPQQMPHAFVEQGRKGGQRECMTGVQGVLSPFALTVQRRLRGLGRRPDALPAVLRRRIVAPGSRTVSSPLTFGCGFGWLVWASEPSPALGTLQKEWRAAPAGTPPGILRGPVPLRSHRPIPAPASSRSTGKRFLFCVAWASRHPACAQAVPAAPHASRLDLGRCRSPRVRLKLTSTWSFLSAPSLGALKSGRLFCVRSFT